MFRKLPFRAADNIELSAGSGGAIVATDEVTGSVHYQLIKPAFGGLGVATLVTGSTPLPVQGTTDFPLPVTILGGTVAAITGTVPVSGSVSIIGGTVGVNVTGGALTGTSPISGSVSIIGTVLTNTTVTMGTVPALLGTSQVAGSVSIIGTSPVSGSVSIIGGTVGVNVTGGALTGTSPVSGSVSIIGGTLGVNVTGGSVAIGGTVTIIAGSLNISNQGGSVQVSAIVGTLPGFARNRLFNVAAGVTGTVLGTVGLAQTQGTGDYLSHLVIMVGSTDANQVILIDGTTTLYNQTVAVSVPGPGKGTYTVPIVAYSRFGPWKLTTGGGATATAVGIFTT